MSAETLGRRLFLLRIARRLSQQKVADGINAATGKRINKSMISRWENDRDLPTVENAIALARFLAAPSNTSETEHRKEK